MNENDCQYQEIEGLNCTLIVNDIHWPEMYDDEDYYYQQDYTIKLLNYVGKSLPLT